jgi:hypothetical protein
MNIQLEVLKAQITVAQSYVTYYDARIRTGVYKSRKVHHGGFDGPLLTEEELLKDEIQTMHRHIHRMNDLIDGMWDIDAEQKAEATERRLIDRLDGPG